MIVLARLEHEHTSLECWCKPVLVDGEILVHNDELGVYLNTHPVLVAEWEHAQP